MYPAAGPHLSENSESEDSESECPRLSLRDSGTTSHKYQMMAIVPASNAPDEILIEKRICRVRNAPWRPWNAPWRPFALERDWKDGLGHTELA
jgi:hypothetical protein